jgi:hypothetical protein
VYGQYSAMNEVVKKCSTRGFDEKREKSDDVAKVMTWQKSDDVAFPQDGFCPKMGFAQRWVLPKDGFFPKMGFAPRWVLSQRWVLPRKNKISLSTKKFPSEKKKFSQGPRSEGCH